MSRDALTAVEHEQRRLMERHFGVHRVDHRALVDHRSDAGKNLADRDTAFTLRPKLKRRLHQGARLALSPQVAARIRLTVVLLQSRLVVETVDMRRRAIQEQVDDVLRLRREVGRLRRQRARRRLTRQRGA